MNLVSIRDIFLLDHDVVGNRLLIRRAIKNSKGIFYDISVGIDGANFDKATSPTLDAKIQKIVHGCLNALQQQLDAQHKNVEKLDQLGFIIQKPAPDKPYESHALVAEVGQSVLDKIKTCPKPDYSSLKSLHFGDTSTMNWRPEDAAMCTWVEKKDFSVHSGLVQLCEDFKDFSVGSYSSALSASHPPSDVVPPVDALPHHHEDAVSQPPPPDAVPPHHDKDAVLPPLHAEEPPIGSGLPVSPLHSPKPLSDKKRLLEPQYSKWQYWQRPWGYARARMLQVWDRISLRQFLGDDEVKDVNDKAFVKNAVQNNSKAIQNLFARWSKVAPAYYRVDFPTETSEETGCLKEHKTQFYLDYLVKSIRDHWENV
jgi:hypothetical protein